MDPEPEAPTIDPSNFDAIGVMTEVVISLRGAAMERQMDIEATVSAPPGRHHLTVFARTGGHVLLGVRFDAVTLSRRNVVDAALTKRGWQLDEDDEGATRRFPPGTPASERRLRGPRRAHHRRHPRHPSPRHRHRRDRRGRPPELLMQQGAL